MTARSLSRRQALRGVAAFVLATALVACNTTPTGTASLTLNADSPIVQRLDSGMTCTGVSVEEAERICILGRADGTIVDPLTLESTCTCVAARTR